MFTPAKLEASIVENWSAIEAINTSDMAFISTSLLQFVTVIASDTVPSRTMVSSGAIESLTYIHEKTFERSEK
jgi:hypothetical protein